jgi:hypothetical protein
MTATGVSGCATGPCEVDGPPRIYLDDTLYIADLGQDPLDASAREELLATIETDQSDEFAQCGFEPENGDSTLPIGAQVYSIKGTPTSEAIAADLSGVYIKFEAEH